MQHNRSFQQSHGWPPTACKSACMGAIEPLLMCGKDFDSLPNSGLVCLVLWRRFLALCLAPAKLQFRRQLPSRHWAAFVLYVYV